ncbi:hypothetical protein U1E44_14020 [Arenibacter sp. GZD96]|uniref:hypothetical protein n=1 Tax=Aurantibrevibacter litoralis TaxID=3106030 RepID=UPI002AFE8C94|nr:hypothetical protein [Arenibacter sp. GZD-96]MEA1787214.1 hypothetical protein [Arenibacter sp. GZD-96]
MKPSTDNGTTRREFIEQMSLLGLASMLPLSFFSCGNDAADIDYQGSGLAPYKVWEEMLMALETSPDHLEGRMKKLIAEGDPKAMFHFVRDEIYLMPTSQNSLNKMGELMKYGIKGVLRYGFATPREKAELLNKMYNDAGINSRVIYERTNIQVDEVPAFFFRPIDRSFAPKISKKTFKRWEAEMNYKQSENSAAKNVDQDIAQSIALANELWDELPNKDQINPHKFDFRWDNYSTPTVEFTYQEQTMYAHLFDPKVNFGALKNDNGGSIKEADETVFDDQKIKISLNFTDGIDLREEKELVSGEWLAYELVGNQIVVNFLHGLSLQEQTYTNIGNLRVFTPALSFQSFDMNAEEMDKKSFLGNPITLEGRTIDLSENSAQIGNHPLLINADKDLQKSVEKIEIKAVPNTYPLVKLEVKPLNNQGEFVEGLSAADFAINDNDNPIAALMERNERAPRILILYDGSLSMPDEYYGENMDLFISQLENSIKENYKGAIITKWQTPSELFTWLLKASQTDNDLIIYATDGDNNDAFDDRNINFYKSGPPALVLNVYNSDQKHRTESFTKMAEATNGAVFNAKDQSLVIESIVEFIDSIEIPPYVFTYYVTDKEADHTAKISVDAQRVAASANYEFISFPENGMALGQNIAGLYLNIKVDNKEINRIYAGWDPIINSNRTPTITDFLDVKCHLLGSAILSFEGEGPTFSNALSDVLKYRLSTREWGEAVMNNEIKKAREAIEKGSFTSTDAFLPLMAPLSNQVTAHSFTFSSGLRVGIIKNKIGLDGRTTETNFDFVPTSNYVTFSKNEEDNFKINLIKTAQLAIREKEIFQQSTFHLLKGKNKVERATVVNEEWFVELYQKGDDALFWRETIYRHDGSYKIIDAAAQTKAFWHINSKTGELYGILPNGTGGGTNSIEQQLKELNRVIDLYMLLFTGMGVASTPIGIVATYGKTLVKLYAIVTEVLIIMDPTGMDDKISEAMKELACNIHKEIMFFSLGKVGEVMGGFDLLISLMGGDGLPGTGCS